MFRAAEEGARVRLELDGEQVTVRAGISVAAAVLEAGSATSRLSAKKHEERGPFCQMGVCYECLMDIDGRPNQQSCLVEVREGMRVRRQKGEAVFPLAKEAAQ